MSFFTYTARFLSFNVIFWYYREIVPVKNGLPVFQNFLLATLLLAQMHLFRKSFSASF